MDGAASTGAAPPDPAPPARDAVPRDRDASYERAAAAPDVTLEERAVISAQLGRPARGRSAVVHRCVYGLPTVLRVAPRLDDGTPFPTVFWLSCPIARSAVGRLEASGALTVTSARLVDDQELADAYRAGHERYVEFRTTLGPPPPRDPGAGGMPDHVKCFHVQVAHHLATGDNPVGAWAYDEIAPMACPGPCVPTERLAAAYPEAYGHPPAEEEEGRPEPSAVAPA